MLLGDILIFREDVSISEVLEKTYHFEQNRKKLYSNKDVGLANILKEIDAKEFLLKNSKKFRIPRNENDETQMHLKHYHKQLEKWKRENGDG